MLLVRHTTAHHSTAQHSTSQRSAAQRSAAKVHCQRGLAWAIPIVKCSHMVSKCHHALTTRLRCIKRTKHAKHAETDRCPVLRQAVVSHQLDNSMWRALEEHLWLFFFFAGNRPSGHHPRHHVIRIKFESVQDVQRDKPGRLCWMSPHWQAYSVATLHQTRKLV